MPTTTGAATEGGTLPDTDGATSTGTATESLPVVECPVAFTNTVSDIDGDGHNDAYIFNQEQLAELAGCTDMSGSLYLNSGVTDLAPLVSLRHIAGKLDISGSSYTTEPKGLLLLAGLEALESVGGLVIKNVSMTDLEPLAGLTSIPGDVQITGLLRLESLEGLHKLEYIGGELNIGGGKQLVDLNGLRNLQQVGTHIFISQLEITSLHGLEALTEVGVPGGEPSTIRLYGLHQLTSLDALAIDWHDAHALWIYQSAISDLGILARSMLRPRISPPAT